MSSEKLVLAMRRIMVKALSTRTENWGFSVFLRAKNRQHGLFGLAKPKPTNFVIAGFNGKLKRPSMLMHAHNLESHKKIHAYTSKSIKIKNKFKRG